MKLKDLADLGMTGIRIPSSSFTAKDWAIVLKHFKEYKDSLDSTYYSHVNLFFDDNLKEFLWYKSNNDVNVKSINVLRKMFCTIKNKLK